MRWSGATGAIARCKNRSIGYVRKPRSAPAWRWTCGEKPKGQGVAKPSTPYMRPRLPKATRSPRYSLDKPREFLAATGLTLAEFECLLSAFPAAYEHQYPPDLTYEGKARQRSAGGGAQGTLSSFADKLL